MALHVSATSVQNDFRFYLYVFVCFCFTGAVKLLISERLLVWRRGGDILIVYPPDWICPIKGLLVSLTWPTFNCFHT